MQRQIRSIGQAMTAAEQVMALFKAGRSKSEIAAELGKTRAQVAKLLAQAMRGVKHD